MRLLDLPVGVLPEEFLPALGAAFRYGLLAAAQSFDALVAHRGIERIGDREVVAERHGHAVGGVEPLGRLFQREDAADNGGDLLLGGRSGSLRIP